MWLSSHKPYLLSCLEKTVSFYWACAWWRSQVCFASDWQSAVLWRLEYRQALCNPSYLYHVWKRFLCCTNERRGIAEAGWRCCFRSRVLTLRRLAALPRASQRSCLCWPVPPLSPCTKSIIKTTSFEEKKKKKVYLHILSHKVPNCGHHHLI